MRDDDDDELPRKKAKPRADDDDGPRKRPTRADDDDDDRPRKKPVSRRDDDDDDNRPRKKPASRRDDDDDDRPRRRSRRDDDDDRPKRAKKSGAGLVLILALVGGVGLLLAIGVVVVIVIALNNEAAQQEAVLKETVDTLNDMVNTLNSVKDKETAKAAAPKIEQIAAKLHDLKKKAEALPKISVSEDERLKKKYQTDAIQPKLQQAMLKALPFVLGEPAFMNALKKMEKLK